MGRTRRLRRLQLTRALLKYHTHTRRSPVSASRFASLCLSCNHPPRRNRSRVTSDARASPSSRARDSVTPRRPRRRSRSSSRASLPGVVVLEDLAAMSRTAGRRTRATGASSRACDASCVAPWVRPRSPPQTRVLRVRSMRDADAIAGGRRGGDGTGGGEGDHAFGGGRRSDGEAAETRRWIETRGGERGASGETRADGDAGWTSSGGGTRALRAGWRRKARWSDGASSRGERTVRARVRAESSVLG